MKTGGKLYQLLQEEDNIYNSNPKLIKLILDYKGKDGHKKIQTALFKKLINNYVSLNQELNEKIEQITKLSETDQLTQIYNRVKLVKELEKEIERVKRYKNKLSLIMFDIDHFKSVNDNFGHDIGDIVLVKLSEIVSGLIRKTDIFARWGGEEFMVLLPNTELEGTFKLAEKLRKNLAKHKFKKVGQVTCSFGVTVFAESDNFDSFIKRADDALYQAKESGRNQVVKFRANT